MVSPAVRLLSVLLLFGAFPALAADDAPTAVSRLPLTREQLLAGFAMIVPTAATQPATWHWTTAEPAKDWAQPAFADGGWQSGQSSFGTAGTPGVEGRLHTTWDTSDIWIRRQAQLPATLGANLRLLIHHDNDAEVYLDGVLAWRSQNIETRDYSVFEISPEAREKLKAGAVITIAAHAHNRTGGQAIDVGLVNLN